MSSASSKHRKRLKEDPQKYAEYLKNERERKKRSQQKMHSEMEQAADHCVDNFIIDHNFLGKTSETYERYVFNTRKQKAHETMDDYISALSTLASTCNFCDCLKDSLLRDRIVLGIKDNSTRKRLLQEADLNLENCIAMCRAAEATSPSQPVKTVTRTEGTTAVQAGSVSSGDQRPGKKQEFSMSLRRCYPMASPEEVEMSEVKLKIDVAEDHGLQWTTEHQSSGFPRDRTEHQKLEPAWSLEEDSPDQPSAVCSTTQPMSDNTSGSLLSLNTSHECYLCSAVFVLVSSLELHLASVHGDKLDMVLPVPSTPDRCDAGNCSNTDIDKEVDSHGNRKMTAEEKEKSRQHVCDVCGKSFSNSYKLKIHKMIHDGVRPYVCDVCCKGFTERGNLNKHKLTHNIHKPFVCDVCSKGFTRAGGLRIHKRLHTGERPYKCPHCDSDFKDSGSLQCHLKSVHEGHRPHVCDLCWAAFFKSSDLTVHRRIHTGECPHMCSECGKGFSLSSTLRRHFLTHTGQKPHSCPHCPYACRRSDDLKKHIQKKHQ